jgi:hypothetical protein
MYIVLCLWIIYLYLVLLEKASGSRSAFHLALLTGLIGGIAILFKEGSVVVIVPVLLLLLLASYALTLVWEMWVGKRMAPAAVV